MNIRQGQATWPEMILLKQVLDRIPDTKLPLCAEKERLYLTLKDGVLCLENEQGTIRLVHVLKIFRMGVIHRAHYKSYSAHFGKKKMVGAIRTRFIWGTLSRDVKKVLRTCIHCWSQAKEHLHSQVPQVRFPIRWPRDIMAVDIFGLRATARSDAHYILGCINHFTRYFKLIFFERIKEEEVVEFLRDRRITQHEVPRVILSDKKRQFIAEVARKLCAFIGARKIHSSPCDPQGNSVCKSFMKAVKRALASLISKDETSLGRLCAVFCVRA